MTPQDMSRAVEGYQRRIEIGWQQAAWIAHHAYVAQIGSKKAPKPDELLGGAFTRKKTRRQQAAED
jgi:hypothetical protein